MDKRKILVVDDDASVIKFLEAGLSSKGYEVISAANGSDGIHQAKSEKPEAIILDIMMAGQDGTEVSTILREDMRTQDIPIIFITGLKAKSEINEEEDPDQDPILAKPVDIEELAGKIEYCIGERSPS